MNLKSRIRPAYGGFFLWRDPITKVEVKGTYFDMVMELAYAERRANGAPIGLDFEKEVLEDVCAHYPDECENVPEGHQRRLFWSMGEIVRGTMAFAHRKITGGELVTQEVATQRASICAGCPKAVFFSKPCTGLCSELVGVLGGTGGRSTPYDSDLRACGVCGCWTRVAVWFPLDSQCIGVDDKMKAEFASVGNCWKKC